MERTITVTKQGTKKLYKFHCEHCETEWMDEKWEVKEELLTINAFLHAPGTDIKLPTSMCPTCTIRSQFRLIK